MEVSPTNHQQLVAALRSIACFPSKWPGRALLTVDSGEAFSESRTIRSESLVYLAAYVLLNPLRAFVTVNDPFDNAETLIQ